MTPYDLGRRFLGVTEISGSGTAPAILWFHSLTGGAAPDEVAWCSSFVSAMCWLALMPRSPSKAARSWLTVGTPVPLTEAVQGDVVVLWRGNDPQPGPAVLDAPGHVGFLDRVDTAFVWLLGGNQDNSVSIAPFPKTRVLGVRRLT